MANTFRESGDLDQALFYYIELLDIEPEHFGGLVNLGTAFEGLNRPEDALTCYQKALKVDPNSYQLLVNIGNVYSHTSRVEQALDFFDRAIALSPSEKEAYWNKSLALLLKGDYKQAWPMYEVRWDLADVLMNIKIPFKQPRWTGQSLKNKKIMLVSEQGLGDTLQFCRYVPLLKKLGAEVSIIVQPGLDRLLKSLDGISEVVTEVNHTMHFDYYCPTMSVPGVLKTTLETIPTNIPYLFPDPKLVEQWRPRFASEKRLKVGIVWSGNPRKHDIKSNLVDRRRSMALFAMTPLFDNEKVAFYSLQKGEAAQHLAASPYKDRVMDFTNELRDFADTAALAAHLDLVISVDTSVVHLAGALGKPVWVLSRFDGCWRWLLNREDSPWYPNARVFRQSQPGDWDSVIKNVNDALIVETSK